MNLRAFVAAAFLLPSSSVLAAIGDPCTPDVTDPNTGEVTTENFAERCEGTNVVGCFAPAAGGDPVETAQDCAALFDGAPVGGCEVFDFGPRCSFNDGDACVFASADNPFIPFPCATDDSACVNGTCVAGAGACTFTEGAPSTCLATGESAFCAPWDQTVGITCDGFAQINELDTGGGALTCTGAGVCTGIGEGGQCVTDVFECAPPNDCVGESATTFGACGTAGGDEGEGEGEGDDDAECTQDSDCGDNETCEDGTCKAPPPACTNMTPVQSIPFAGLALVTLLVPMFARRRRG